MKVIDLINNSKKTAFSFEILPPLKGTGIEKLYQTVDTLREFDPKYINITTHRSEYVYKDLGNGLFQRNRLRRRPGTVAVAAAIQNKYNITVVPHILCSGFTREETEYVLLDLQFLNITDLLVLRGDKAKHESVFTPEGDGYHHAIELQEQIKLVIGQLPERCREVFLLSRFTHLKNREIADKLQISTTAVEKHISKALALFERHFKDKYPVDIYIMVLAWVIMNE